MKTVDVGFLAEHLHVDGTVNASDRQIALTLNFSDSIEIGLGPVFVIQTTIMEPFIALVLASGATVSPRQ